MKVAVIGAGTSGLTCIKICKDYGFEVICYEKTNDIGGLWRYKENDCPGQASVMRSTIINTSKELMAFSDFPPPAEFPNFMHNTKVLEYNRMYAKKFDLVKSIKFNHEILRIEKMDEFKINGRWKIEYNNHLCDEKSMSENEIFEAVFVATGHHTFPYTPDFEGISGFEGRIIHSHSYKHQKGFENRKVVVVGIGNSGGDIAVELAAVTAQVYLVTRRGNWCLSRIGYFGIPNDMTIIRRLVHYIAKYISIGLIKRFVEFQANIKFNQELYGLGCKHDIGAQHPMVNDTLPNLIMSGGIVIKPNIKHFLKGKSILFEDGTRVDDIDDLILCTGYDIAFPFIAENVIKVEENRVDTLFKNIFPINLEHPTLFIIGLIQPIGAIAPISEMQARVCCEVLAKKVILPPGKQMELLCKLEREKVRKRYVESRRHTVQVDYIEYMDDLAEIIGAKPNLVKMLLKDFRLGLNLLFAPTAPYQYRLEGPHKWIGARQAQLTIWERTFYHLKQGREFTRKRSMTLSFYIMMGILVVLLFLLILRSSLCK